MTANKASKVITLNTTTKPYLERDENLVRYYGDIRKFELIDDTATKSLFSQYRKATGKKKELIKEQIFHHNARLVVSLARKFCTNSDCLNDLIEEGNIGLLNAIDKYDETRGTSFPTFALFHIRREINLFKTNYGSLVQQTNRSKTDSVARNLISDFIQKEERTPTTNELLDIYNKHCTTKSKLISNHEDLVNVEYVFIDSLETPHEECTDCQSFLDYNAFTSTTNLCEQTMEVENLKNTLECLMDSLTTKERAAIRLMYGMDTGFEESLPSIGSILGCSSERARQLCVSAIKKMQEKSVNYAY